MNFNFIITEECNWECDYCFFPEIEYPKKPNMEILKKHLPYLRDIGCDGYMDVQGGEIGLVPVHILEYFFETMGQKMFISTNGVFLNKKMHLNEKIRPYIKMIQWHVYPNPHGNVKSLNHEDDDIFISKGIVHDNIDEMIDFINNNKHIQFDYIDIEYPVWHGQIKHDRDKYVEFYNKINHLENLTEDAKQRIEKRIDEPDDLRAFCTNFNDSILINLVSEKICLCQRNLHVNIKLTEENIKRRLRHRFPLRDHFDLSENTCGSCGRLYEGKTRKIYRV